MCDPVTMTVLTIASIATTAVGGIQSGRAQQAAARYQGQLQDINAINADRAARDALERGELDAVKHGREVAALRSRQELSFASQGLDLGFGSPADVVGDTNRLGNEDNARIYENAGREAEGFRINAQNYRAGAAGSRAEASNIGTATIINTGSTLLSGASQLAGQWKKYGTPKFGK